jgi:hypothetical protein
LEDRISALLASLTGITMVKVAVEVLSDPKSNTAMERLALLEL